MSELKGPPRKKLFQDLAVIDVDRCTGCGACIEVCPLDCIKKVASATYPQSFCEIDGDRCIGCRLCARLPRRGLNPYELRVCPWEAITMVPHGEHL